MLTRNFYSLLYAAIAKNFPKIGVNVLGEANKGLTSTLSIDAAMFNGTTTAIQNSSSSKCVAFGSGVTPSTPSDYTLESQITTGITIINPYSATFNLTDDYVEITATYGISATKDTVISEIGLIDYNNGNAFLLDRTVLENPIEIPTGQSKQVTYTVRINYPTA